MRLRIRRASALIDGGLGLKAVLTVAAFVAVALLAGLGTASSQTTGELDLNGVAIQVEPLTLSGDFTISAFVTLDGEVSNADALLGSGTDTRTGQNLNFYNGQFRLFAGRPDRDVVVADTALEPGVSTHFSIVRSGATTSIYVDGVLDATGTGWTGDFTINQIGAGANSLLSGGTEGQIDDLKIWNISMSEPEILEVIAGVNANAGLIRDYTFDGDANVIEDLTGTSADAPLTPGATLVPVDDGGPGDGGDPGDGGPSNPGATNALVLDNQRVDIDDIVLSDDFTLSGWFFFDEGTTVSNDDGVISSADASINFFDQRLRIFLRNLGGDVLIANSEVEAGEWVHVSVVRDDGIARLYVNGNLDVTSTSSGFWNDTRTTWTTDLLISDLFGGIPSGSTGLEGQVDDFQIWDVARSQADIAGDLRGNLTSTAGLLRRYTFDDSNGQIVDSTGNSAPVAAPVGSSFVASTAPFAVPRNESDFTDTQVAGGFDLPIDMAFLPDGRMLVIEKGGIVHIVADPTVAGSASGVVLDTSAITLNDAERGLLAVEIDPNFESNGFVYFYHVIFENVNGTQQGKTTVSRYQFVEGAGGINSSINPNSQTVLWQEWDFSRNTTHQGGGLAIAYEPINGNDPSPYKLYITTSDDGSPTWTDDLNRDEGKVHRINLTDGSIPTDNPYYQASAAANYTPSVDTSSAFNSNNQIMTIHSFGLRNAWRASYDQPSETLFIGEVGAGNGSFEDIHIANETTAGESYGWPQQTGFLNNPDAPGNPFLSYGRNVAGVTDGNASVTGGVVYRGDLFPDEYQDAYFYGDWANNWIRYATVDFTGNRPEVVTDNFFKDTTGRVLAFEEGPDGALYYLTGFQTGAVFSFEGAVNRLDFGAGNRAPEGEGIIVSNSDLSSTTAPHTVQFSADVSDPDGDPLTYFWSFGAGADIDGDGFGDTEVSSAVNPTFTYDELGAYRVDLTVTDSNNTSVVFAPVFITVGNAPTATITGIVDGGTWRAGETFTVNGFATDNEDGALANSQLTISSAYAFDGLLRPGPFPETTLTNAGVTFTTPTTGTVQSFLDSFTIFLTATDSDGLETTTQIEMSAEQVQLTFDSPVEIVFDEKTEAADFTFESTVGFNHTVAVPQTIQVGGQQLSFQFWADNPTLTNPSRTIVTPAVATTYEPVYG